MAPKLVALILPVQSLELGKLHSINSPDKSCRRYFLGGLDGLTYSLNPQSEAVPARVS
jgi:hypothetical protein